LETKKCWRRHFHVQIRELLATILGLGMLILGLGMHILGLGTQMQYWDWACRRL